VSDADCPSLPIRDAAGHKGTFGTVCVLGGYAAGPRVMIGAPALTAEAALRMGAGLAVLALPRPIMAAALTICPSATGLALPVDGEGQLRASDVAELLDEHVTGSQCLAVGPGWGSGPAEQQILVRVLSRDETPAVVDASAINCLAALPEFQLDLRCPMVITPHPGEYKRLARPLGIDADPVSDETRQDAARIMAQRLGCIVVLKGDGTVISDGIHCVVNETGNVALATAGTGDVLTGMIAGLVSQWFRPSLGSGSHQYTAEDQGGMSLFDCARAGVHLHGVAADLWATENGDAGLTALELTRFIPAAIRAVRGRSADTPSPAPPTSGPSSG
jgi:NAD(P)H-hydrate epimerase